MIRKCSMRCLFVRDAYKADVITQDMRRRRRIVTGYYAIGLPWDADLGAIARANGCSIIVKRKPR